MKVSIKEAEAKLFELIQLLEDGKEEEIVISKSGKPLVKMTLSNQIGTVKEKMNNFDISLEEFDSIKIDEFNNYL